MELMDVVNEQDEVVGQASRDDVHEKRLSHRIAHVWIFNSAGDLLVQKRSRQCGFCPLHWSMPAAGHIRAGESYEAAARRELSEELGVELPITFVDKVVYPDPRGATTFLGVYRAQAEGPFSIDPREVERVDFFSPEEIVKMIARGEPFHPQFVHVWELIFSKR